MLVHIEVFAMMLNQHCLHIVYLMGGVISMKTALIQLHVENRSTSIFKHVAHHSRDNF